MFLGEYRHNLDSKERLTIPSKYRDDLGDGLYFVLGLDLSLMAMPPQTFEKILVRLQALNIADPDVRLLNRRILGSATQIDMDKNGRVLIPEFLRQRAGLERELILVGQGAYFEIWSPLEWAKQEAAQLDTEANNQRFKVLDLRLGSE
jgi:MraZ protein